LLYVWNSEGTFVNEALVSEGLARVEVIAPNDAREGQLRGAERRAITATVGLHNDRIACTPAAQQRAKQQPAATRRADARAVAAAKAKASAAVKRRAHAQAVAAAKAKRAARRAAAKVNSAGSQVHRRQSQSGGYPGYTGPRCYAPGGKIWHPC
jgi:Staphylococcal nuclease homologue